jgi:hypothetical protein
LDTKAQIEEDKNLTGQECLVGSATKQGINKVVRVVCLQCISAIPICKPINYGAKLCLQHLIDLLEFVVAIREE